MTRESSQLAGASRRGGRPSADRGQECGGQRDAGRGGDRRPRRAPRRAPIQARPAAPQLTAAPRAGARTLGVVFEQAQPIARGEPGEGARRRPASVASAPQGGPGSRATPPSGQEPARAAAIGTPRQPETSKAPARGRLRRESRRRPVPAVQDGAAVRPHHAEDRRASREPSRRGRRPRRAGPGPAARAPRASSAARSRCAVAGPRRAAAGRSPPRARWELIEAAARTARSTASSPAAVVSSTTSGGDSPPLSRRCSTSSPVLATVGQWMREAGVPRWCGRSPSTSKSMLPMLKPPPLSPRAALPLSSSPLSAPRAPENRSGSIRGRTSTAPPMRASTLLRWRPNGSAIVTARFPSSQRPRCGNRRVTWSDVAARPAVRQPARRRAAGARTALPAAAAGRRGARPGAARDRPRRCSRRRGRHCRAVARAEAAVQSRATTAISASAMPGTYRGGTSKRTPPSTSARPRTRVARAAFIARYSAGVCSRASRDDRGGLGRTGPGREQQPVAEHRGGQLLDVVGKRVVPSLQRGSGLRRAEEEQAGARAGAELHAGVRAGALAEGDDVAPQRLRAVHGRHRGLRGEHGADVGDRLQVEDAVTLGVRGEHLRLLAGARIPERESHHEAVQLRLRQRVGALVLDRVLGRDDEERAGQLMRLPVHRHAPLLHALEQARLGLRRGPVDLVDEDDVGEDRPGMEVEGAGALVEDVGADDVRRQQVNRALDAGVLGVHGAGQRPRQRRLADPGMVLDQHVALGEEGDEEVARGPGRGPSPRGRCSPSASTRSRRPRSDRVRASWPPVHGRGRRAPAGRASGAARGEAAPAPERGRSAARRARVGACRGRRASGGRRRRAGGRCAARRGR